MGLKQYFKIAHDSLIIPIYYSKSIFSYNHELAKVKNSIFLRLETKFSIDDIT